MIDIQQPPRNEEDLEAKAKEIVKAAHAMGIQIDPAGFLMSWASGTLVLVDRDDETKEIVGLAFMATGNRWTDSLNKASILRITGDVDALLQFAKTAAKATGAESLYYEEKALDSGEGFSRYVVKELFLD